MREMEIHPRKRRKSKGQSIVEFTLLLPLLLMLLSSLIEFGFALNEYLDLIDTTRETARYLSDQSPFANQDTRSYRELFYTEGVDEMERTIQRAGWIDIDENSDDLIISVFAVTGSSTVVRYPTEFTDTRSGRCNGLQNGGSKGWRENCNKLSKFSNTDLLNRISGVPNTPPDTGIVLVEVYYDYRMKLGLPWVTGIVGDYITLHAYSFAPNAFAEPD
ncbi:MAG: hypothetical protein GTO18_08325 [Anaerolineales bacterium]|nr:hypothetical protein [Anaerolineales bacterium]